MAQWVVFPDETPSKQAGALAEQIERDGGRALAIFQDPVGDQGKEPGSRRVAGLLAGRPGSAGEITFQVHDRPHEARGVE